MNQENYITEYNYPCEIVGEVENGWRIRISRKDEVTEKTVHHKPILDEWVHDGKTVEKNGRYFVLEKYTVYQNEFGLVRAYKGIGVERFSDDLVYETEVGKTYNIVENSPFLNEEEIHKLMDKIDAERVPILSEIRELEEKISGLKNNLKDITEKYQIDKKCKHKWELNYENEIDDGKTTEKVYYCQICEKEDTHYWHKLC